MATTIASIDITSTDLLSDKLSLSAVTTLTNAGSATGVTQTTGLARKKVASASLADLITVANTDVTAAKSAKVYIKNTSTATDKYGLIGLGDSTGTPIYIGRLYGGDWMFIPYEQNDPVADNGSDNDIEVEALVGGPQAIEWIMFTESTATILDASGD